MNNQKPENKSGDHEDGDHYQPINLVAARTTVPVTTFSASGTTVTTQPLTMRTHMDTKPGLMTLYFRTQAPRTQGQVMGPIVGAAQVSSSQHFGAKSAQDFKNTTSFTVIRMPSDMSQVQGGSTTSPSSGSLTPGILPSALSGSTNRHMIPTAVQPVIAAGHSGPSLASLIRGSHQVSPAGHVIHPPFSSHVPRGPAAVASMSAAPKSAVATPILRTPHSSGMALAPSSMMALHAPVRVKSPTLAGRTATPPVVSTTSMPQVVDLQKSSIGHTLPSSVAHVGLGSRSVDGSVVRSSGSSHPSSITIAKPVNISQPIVQHLQQPQYSASIGKKLPLVYDKGTLKTVTNLSPATTTSSSHQSTPSAFTSVSETSAISRAPVSTSYSSIMQVPSANATQPLQQLRATHVPQAVHGGTSVSSSGASHQTLTVIAAKSLVTTNHPIALATPSPRSATPITTVSGASGSISIVPGPRSLTLSNALTPATIPVAKVYPQSTVTPRTTTESTTQESVRASSFINQGLISSSARVTAPTTTTSSSSVISEKQPENTAVRFTSLAKPQSGTGSYAPASTTYLYHDQYASNLTMHHYNSNSSSQGFTTTQLRPVSFSQQHSTTNASNHSSISVSNPVMVAVESRHHVALHSPYAGSSGKASDLSTPVSLSTNVTTTTSAAVTSVVTTSFSALQSQSTVNNHTSPRPSILRKRPSESICSIAKKNLTGSLCSTEPVSPRPDLGTSMSFTSVLSPKSVSSEKPKEAVAPTVSVSESQNILIPVIPAVSIKKEPGITENSSSSNETGMRDTRPVEASPRKKPRKQLLAANELMETHSSDGEENNFEMKIKVKEEPDDDKSKCITYYKRPSMQLLDAYRQSWKPRHNHFARYSDVKPKEEKKPTVSELANQKGILQQANGWKIYHLTAQMDEVVELEDTVYSRLSDLLELVENDSPATKNWNSLNGDEVRILNKLTDLIKGNLQRSKIVQEQVLESKQQAVKVLDHKTNVLEMVNKYISKRPLKKKDKS